MLSFKQFLKEEWSARQFKDNTGHFATTHTHREKIGGKEVKIEISHAHDHAHKDYSPAHKRLYGRASVAFFVNDHAERSAAKMNPKHAVRVIKHVRDKVKEFVNMNHEHPVTSLAYTAEDDKTPAGKKAAKKKLGVYKRLANREGFKTTRDTMERNWKVSLGKKRNANTAK